MRDEHYPPFKGLPPSEPLRLEAVIVCGSTVPVSVSALAGCAWNAVSEVSWVRLEGLAPVVALRG